MLYTFDLFYHYKISFSINIFVLKSIYLMLMLAHSRSFFFFLIFAWSVFSIPWFQPIFVVESKTYLSWTACNWIIFKINLINICPLIEILIYLHYITGRIRFMCTVFLFAFYTFCLFCSSVHLLLLFVLTIFSCTTLISIVNSFFKYNYFLRGGPRDHN